MFVNKRIYKKQSEIAEKLYPINELSQIDDWLTKRRAKCICRQRRRGSSPSYTPWTDMMPFSS